MRLVCLMVGKKFKAGDPRPKNESYTDWLDWAEAQHRGKLRQRQCPNCSHWLFPQEFEDHVCQGLKALPDPTPAAKATDEGGEK